MKTFPDGQRHINDFFLLSTQALQTPGQHTSTNNSMHSTGVFLPFVHTHKDDFQIIPHRQTQSSFVCVERAKCHADVGERQNGARGGHITKTKNGDDDG